MSEEDSSDISSMDELEGDVLAQLDRGLEVEERLDNFSQWARHLSPQFGVEDVDATFDQRLRITREVDRDAFWSNFNLWVAHSGNVSVVHLMMRTAETAKMLPVHTVGNQLGSTDCIISRISQFSVPKSWFAVEQELTYELCGENPRYCEDKEGYLCALVNCHADKQKILSASLRLWGFPYDFEWDILDAEVEGLWAKTEDGKMIKSSFFKFHRRFVHVLRISRCRLITPSSSVKRRLEVLLQTMERNEVTDYKEIVTRKGGDEACALDPTDDPGWPVLADLKGCYMHKSYACPDSRLEELFTNFCSLLSGDSFERSEWRSFFHLLCKDAIQEWKQSNNQPTHDQQDAAATQRSWKIVYGDEEDSGCILCGTLISKSAYPSQVVHRAHILPAIWGACHDKYWWNTVPLCCNCNLSQPKVKRTVGPPDERNRLEHMLLYLLPRKDRLRFIALKFFLEVLQVPSCPIDTIGSWSLIGFTLGFYGIDDEPLRDGTWDFLTLNEEEIAQAWAIIHARRS